MKKITTIAIALFTIASTVKANNTNPATTAVLNASVTNNTVVLNWSSVNNNFEIERSFYSNEFTTISALNMPFASNNVNNFRINDNAAELAGRKVAYYRVKQTNANGTVTYSNTMVVNLNGTQAAAATTTSVKFTAAQNGNATITVKSVTGQTVAVKNIIAGRGNNTVEVENLNNKGIYTAVISVNGIVVDTQKVIAE